MERTWLKKNFRPVLIHQVNRIYYVLHATLVVAIDKYTIIPLFEKFHI